MLVYLTALLVLFGLIDLGPRVYSFVQGRLDSAAWAKWADHWKNHSISGKKS